MEIENRKMSDEDIDKLFEGLSREAQIEIDSQHTPQRKKYNTITEITQDESLNLSEMNDAIWAFLDEHNMTMEDFMVTEEGYKMYEKAAEDRFATYHGHLLRRE